MRDQVVRIWALVALLLSGGGALSEPRYHVLELPAGSGAVSGSIHVEFAWRSQTNNGQLDYTWDWRWGVRGTESEGLYLKRAPLMEWDVSLDGQLVGRLRDRFQGVLPVHAGTWGTGEFRRISRSEAEFVARDVWTEAPIRPLHVVVGLNIDGVKYASLPAQFDSGLSAVGMELLKRRTAAEFGGAGERDSISVEVFWAKSHAEIVDRLQKLISAGHELRRHVPEDPWREVRRLALQGSLRLTHPRLLDIEFGRKKLKVFRAGEMAAVLKSRKDPRHGDSIINFDRVWEKEVDRRQKGFELTEFKRENRVEALVLAGRKQLRAGDHRTALRSFQAARSYGGRMPADFLYLLGTAQLKTGDYRFGAKNLADYSRSALSSDLNYDNCFALLAELRDSGRVASLPADYRRAVEAALRKAPYRFASLHSIGQFHDRSPAEIATAEEKKSMVEIDGHKFFSKKLGVVLDVSGSMSSYLPGLRRKISNDFPDPVAVEVVGCELDTDSKVMSAFERLIIRDKVDHIYWFSDLEDGVSSSALRKLRGLMKANSVVLHVTSVGRSERDLNRLVAEFGGKVVVR